MMLERRSPTDSVSSTSAYQLGLCASQIQCNNNRGLRLSEVCPELKWAQCRGPVVALGDAPA